MGIRAYRPYTPSTREHSVSDFAEVTKSKPEKTLVKFKHRKKGRNNRGIVTCRHRGGGAKKLYRVIDFHRNKHNIPAKVAAIEYDPNRNARIALLHYQDGEKRYILHPVGLKVGTLITSGVNAPLEIGNALPLSQIPLGTDVHNIELVPGKGYFDHFRKRVTCSLSPCRDSHTSKHFPSLEGGTHLCRGSPDLSEQVEENKHLFFVFFYYLMFCV